MDHKDLLEKYRPELRFSKGENFLPMDVTKFIGNSKLIEIGDRKKTDLWKRNSEDGEKNQRGDRVGGNDLKNYLL